VAKATEEQEKKYADTTYNVTLPLRCEFCTHGVVQEEGIFTDYEVYCKKRSCSVHRYGWCYIGRSKTIT
jgi:hypothetical protein